MFKEGQVFCSSYRAAPGSISLVPSIHVLHDIVWVAELLIPYTLFFWTQYCGGMSDDEPQGISACNPCDSVSGFVMARTLPAD
jgi:hypothetical protein